MKPLTSRHTDNGQPTTGNSPNLPVTIRPAIPADEAFLFDVYASTRQDELALVDWSAGQKAAFLRMQFNAQHQYYHSVFPEADFGVILLDGSPVGRLYVARTEEEVRIIDIALLPDCRNRGIGSALLNALLAEAAAASKPVRIHVERFNRALRFYARLGFMAVRDEGVYVLMEWIPGTSGSPAPPKTDSAATNGP